MSSTAQALTLDGHGVVYYREQEVPDAVSAHLIKRFSLSLDLESVVSIYNALQEEAFSHKITYREMLHRLCEALRAAAERQGELRRFSHPTLQRCDRFGS